MIGPMSRLAQGIRLGMMALAFGVSLAFGAHAASVLMPEEFVISHRGAFTPGGLVVLQLQADTQVWLNDARVEQLDGQAMIGFGRDAELTQALRFERALSWPRKSRQQSLAISLTPRAYPVQRIEGLPQKMVTPPPEDLAKIRQQSILKKAARQSSVQENWFSETFQWPLQGRISGVYGSQRFYNGKPSRPHFGVDIAAPRTTPVYAPASGRVTLAQPDMYFEGGLIFLDHGLSLTSVFMHLDSLDVQLGDVVAQGDLIARVGSTGRSTGPHLDWRMYWGSQRVDPALLVPPMTPSGKTSP